MMRELRYSASSATGSSCSDCDFHCQPEGINSTLAVSGWFLLLSSFAYATHSALSLASQSSAADTLWLTKKDQNGSQSNEKQRQHQREPRNQSSSSRSSGFLLSCFGLHHAHVCILWVKYCSAGIVMRTKIVET